MRRVAAMFCTAFFMAITCIVGISQADMVINLDASDNPDHPNAWTNLGTAGGAFLGNDEAPTLEEGTIEIPALGYVQPNAKFYTAKAGRQIWGGPVGANPEVKVTNWSFEFIVRRNGDAFGEEHQFFGFHSSEPLWGGTAMRIKDGNVLKINHPPPHVGPAVEDVEEWWRGEEDFGLRLNEGEWTWIVITGSDETFRVYQDGVEVGKGDPLPFDGGNAMDDIAIGAMMYDERHRSFNGSFSLVRVYNRALSADEVQLGPATAVESVGKLTTTWGRVKATY